MMNSTRKIHNDQYPRRLLLKLRQRRRFIGEISGLLCAMAASMELSADMR
jgi:hypothetical protein